MLALLTGVAVAGPVATSGSSFTVDYNGYTGAGVIPGLAARVDFSRFTFTHDSAVNRTLVEFDMDISNTSNGPITGSRIALLGFNTAESVHLTSSSVSGVFANVDGGRISYGDRVDFCFSGINCSDVGTGGVTIGNTNAARAMLYFRGNISSLNFNDLFIRYKDIVGAVDSRGAIRTAVGVGSSAAPEPAALVTLAAGCLGIWRLRRRRQAHRQMCA